MHFNIFAHNAAANNSEGAKLREMTRLACLGHALHQLGHSVRVEAPPLLGHSPRWKYFRHLFTTPQHGISIGPAEALSENRTFDVAVKCSVGVDRDANYARYCSTLVAHECARVYHSHPKMLHVPFLVHDRVISDLCEHGLMDAYLTDDVDAIRKAARTRSDVEIADSQSDTFNSGGFPKLERKGWVGFCGFRWPHRMGLLKDAPEWVTAKFYDSHPMGGWEHAQWMCGFRGILSLKGDTPKTNLTPLLALLGLPIVCLEKEVEPNAVSLTPDAYIPFTNWEAVKAVLADKARCRSITDNATEIYKQGWSPLGQARLILERL